MQGGVNGDCRANRSDENGRDGDSPARATERQKDRTSGEESDRVEDLSRHHRLGTLPRRGNSLNASAHGMDHADERVDANRKPRRVKNAVRHVLIVPELPGADKRQGEDERDDAEEQSRKHSIDEEPPIPFVLRLELD